MCPTSSGARCLRLRQWSMPYLRTAVRARHGSRWARVRRDVREDLRLAGEPSLPGILWRRGMQRSRRLPGGVHSGATWAAPRLRAQIRRRRWMILSPQKPSLGRIPLRSKGRQVSERDRGSLPTSVTTQMSGRGSVAVSRPRSGTLKVRWSAATRLSA